MLYDMLHLATDTTGSYRASKSTDYDYFIAANQSASHSVSSHQILVGSDTNGNQREGFCKQL